VKNRTTPLLYVSVIVSCEIKRRTITQPYQQKQQKDKILKLNEEGFDVSFVVNTVPKEAVEV